MAHLTPPEDVDYFARKEGAGGDAGVECYWKLKDGTEHAWQAKYFTDNLSTSFVDKESHLQNHFHIY
ncbi:hypothetical protein [Salinibacillus xinjiangensis]|uniref:Uncharacterized protein n=1 Tax=Salinibacillus xinjiangensis TaxID=1229268 RepID=A0A6G1XC38_9BACI|nr:hypothetical protein [Salinibacillus xinjiangensis]MRG88348.1 hypothetical protein [Salinibacillus xinjiangensis]